MIKIPWNGSMTLPVSCSACEIICSGTSYADSAIVDLNWVEGTLYLKN